MTAFDLDLIEEDEILRSIKLNFPNTSAKEITSAEIGRELRSMVSDEKKIALFPSAKELQNILCKTTMDALADPNYKLLKSNVLKRKTKDYMDEIGFYYLRGSIDPTYKKRFLWLEKIVQKWCKENSIMEDKHVEFYLYYPLSTKFEHKMQFKSYAELANLFYQRLKYLKNDLLPRYDKLSSIAELNKKINHGDKRSDRFNGLHRSWEGDNRILIVFPIVAILSGDPNYEKILEEEVLKFVENKKERDKYIMAFGKLRKYGA